MFVARIVSLGAPGIERAEDLLLQAEVLEGRLDDELRLGGDGVQGAGLAQALEAAGRPRVDRVRHPGRGCAARRSRPRGCRSRAALDRGRIDVVEDDLGAGLERDLRDAGTHRAGAHDADDGVRAARWAAGVGEPVTRGA